MLNNTISQLNAEQWSRTYTLWLPWHQLIHCYLDNCKFLYTYQLACTLTTELLLPKKMKNSVVSAKTRNIPVIVLHVDVKNWAKLRKIPIFYRNHFEYSV